MAEAEQLRRYLDLLDEKRSRFAPLVVELDRIVRAHGPALVPDVRYRIQLYALEGDYRTWVCAIDATTKVACLRFLYGSHMNDPARRLRAGSATLSSLDFKSLDEISEEIIAPYVEEAVARYPESREHLRVEEAERRAKRAAPKG